jgi:formylglycine-generating enzyme required for sulfatase activity
VALELPNELYEGGSFAGNVSPFQVYDLVGNVWEWVDEPYESLPPGVNMLRGGRFSLPQDLAFRYAVSPDNPNIEYAGFRCAADQVQ